MPMPVLYDEYRKCIILNLCCNNTDRFAFTCCICIVVHCNNTFFVIEFLNGWHWIIEWIISLSENKISTFFSVLYFSLPLFGSIRCYLINSCFMFFSSFLYSNLCSHSSRVIIWIILTNIHTLFRAVTNYITVSNREF